MWVDKGFSVIQFDLSMSQLYIRCAKHGLLSLFDEYSVIDGLSSCCVWWFVGKNGNCIDI